MAITDRVSDLESQIVSLKGDLKWIRIIGSSALTAIVAFACWAAHDLSTITQHLARIETKIGDPLEVISQKLSNPQNQQAFSASLSLVSSRVRLAMAENLPIPKESIDRLQPAVRQAATTSPNVPQVWQAVGALASAKATLVGAVQRIPNTLPGCDVEHAKPISSTTPLPLPGAKFTTWEYQFSHCTLRLDDLPVTLTALDVVMERSTGTITSTEPEKAASQQEGMIIPIRLADGIVVYGATKPLYAPILILQNCRLDLDVSSVPDSAGRQFLIAALDQAEKGLISTQPSAPY